MLTEVIGGSHGQLCRSGVAPLAPVQVAIHEYEAAATRKLVLLQ